LLFGFHPRILHAALRLFKISRPFKDVSTYRPNYGAPLRLGSLVVGRIPRPYRPILRSVPCHSTCSCICFAFVWQAPTARPIFSLVLQLYFASAEGAGG
jgi:hypothetical protein